ncbi:hypothetical protein BX666DRAFT_1961215 [Dichotomocladium elegans]|nr:hypothetical protein BX666DRAFT_1961215 [Dichotomocladium elegans]
MSSMHGAQSSNPSTDGSRLGQGGSDHTQRRPRRKKRQESLNHLIDFQLPEREIVELADHEHDVATEVSYKPYKKEAFLNANFRFLLDPLGDYTRQLADPDICFDWDEIEQVLGYGASSCPICLETPTAPRIARCGHMFCLACIIHHLHETRACPICWDDMSGSHDLKPVRLLPCRTYQTGDPIDMVLVHRCAGSMFALPAQEHQKNKPVLKVPWNTAPDVMTFSRFMLAGPEYMEEEFRKEEECLRHAAEKAEEDDELAAILMSLDFLDHHKERQREKPIKKTNGGVRRQGNSMTAGITMTTPAVEYYFYQAADGQLFFLSSHAIKVLRHEFGDYADFPTQICPVIQHMEDVTLTEDMRKRLKYLGHLPIGCSITVIEVELSAIVSKETLDQMSSKSLQMRKIVFQASNLKYAF